MQTTENIAKTIRWFGNLVILFSLLLFLWLVVPGIVKYASVKTWNETACTIAASEVIQHSRSVRKPRRMMYAPRVTYHYHVNNETYDSSIIRPFSTTTSDYSKARKMADAYPKDKKTVCYVNPKKPGDAVLDRSYSPVGILLGLIPILLSGVGLSLRVFARRIETGAIKIPSS
ncbi:MAG: DUF3592 domain-containing protein [Candidatus Omnitrophica bacterium]|nr:DUF3592 domain-containing protein [Candidatus Omnitrophota bacterium]MDD5672136.1 DUF3592 domain-containing protein [Candidatus Omnitrophota bacterium]